MTYPVTANSNELVDGLNYALSGPGGTGQSFAGFSTYTPAYLTGNFRIPFTQSTTAALYVAPISLSNAEQLDSRTIKYTFTTAQATAPFALGNGLSVTGITPAAYNSSELEDANASIFTIGVVECTTTYVIVRTNDVIVVPLGTYVSGGSISYTSTDTTWNSTDCDVRVSVQGGLERVFLNAQLDQLLTYNATVPGTAIVTVAINRYTAFVNPDPTNPDLLFDDRYRVTEKAYPFTASAGVNTLDLIETVFAGVIDAPDPGYYRYILEVYFETDTATLQATENQLLLRSISAQVIKP